MLRALRYARLRFAVITILIASYARLMRDIAALMRLRSCHYCPLPPLAAEMPRRCFYCHAMMPAAAAADAAVEHTLMPCRDATLFCFTPAAII